MVAALSMPVIVGFLGLAMDAGIWQLNKHRVQGLADNAALTAAMAATAGATDAQALAEAQALLASAPPLVGAQISTTINAPPSTGSYAGASGAWEVLIRQQQASGFSAMFLNSAPSVLGRAVAKVGDGATCIMGLNTTAPNTVAINNNGNALTQTCVIYTNSSSNSALSCQNNCLIKAATYTVGNYFVNGGRLAGAYNKTHQAPVADPYAAVTPPAAGACTRTTAVTSTATLSPGHYCGGINLNGSKTVTLQSGVYYIDGIFSVTNGATLNANPVGGVTLIINGTYCIGLGDCAIGNGLGNNATLNIVAQSTGPFAGIAMMGPRNGTYTTNQEFTNNSNNNIQGAIYFPSQTNHFTNNSDLGPSFCTQIIGNRVQLDNNANMSTNCGQSGLAQVGTLVAKLVE